jgi:hypothetical protein
VGPIYAISSDGMLHALGQVSGVDVAPPVPFLPANSRFSDLTALGDLLYVTTTSACGDAPDAVWSISIAADGNRTITSWPTRGGKPMGTVAFSADGRLILAVGAGQAAAGGYASAIVALDPKSLEPLDWFTAPDADFVTTPMVIRLQGRELVAAATRDGRIFILDAASLGGDGHTTPLVASASVDAGFSPEALASWQDASGQTWLAIPNEGITALRLVSGGGRISLQPGWTSRRLAAPTAPIVVNGVVFAAASGRPDGRAVLYAFDGSSGRDVWNSGQTLTSFMPPANLWSSNSQVYVGTHDGFLQAFGFDLERKAR